MGARDRRSLPRKTVVVVSTAVHVATQRRTGVGTDRVFESRGDGRGGGFSIRSKTSAVGRGGCDRGRWCAFAHALQDAVARGAIRPDDGAARGGWAGADAEVADGDRPRD